MKRILLFLILLAFLLMSKANDALAQSTGQIKGKVVDLSTGTALPGANIILQGTNYGTISDVDGNFVIDNIAPGNYKVQCSFISYKTITKEVNVDTGETSVNFDLDYDQMMMDEIIVSGVASKNSKGVSTIAVQRINAGQLSEANNYNSVQELLTGKIAGVSLQRSGGGFGAATRFVVRSGGGINGNGQPAIFVDGVRMNNQISWGGASSEGGGISSLIGLNPEDIENIEVIKGPAGASSYGTGAANGVVLITTKRGANKKWEVRYKSTVGFNDMRKLKESEYRNYDYMNNNFFKTGAIVKNGLSISGGSNEIKAFFSAEHNNEDGHTPSNNFEQTNVRLNLDFIPSSKLSIKTSTQYSINEITFPQRGRGDGEFGYLTFARLPYDPNFYTVKPSFFDHKRIDLNSANNFVGSIATSYTPFVNNQNSLKGLSIGLTVGMSNNQNKNLFTQKKTTLSVEGRDRPGERRIAYLNTEDVTFTSDISYSYEKGKFSGTSVIGSQAFNNRTFESFASSSQFATPLISTINAGELIGSPRESSDHYRSAGIFTSHNFSYDNKFLASVMVREDYASVLGSLTSSIVYPAASFAVRWDAFDWMPNVLSLLKTRIAYGETGTLPGKTSGIPVLWSPAESQYGIGMSLSSLGNPGLEPERVKQLELGLDAEYKNFGIEFTYYRENATNSIIPRPNVPSSGQNAASPLYNLGSVEGSGWEAQLHADFAGRALGGWRANFTLNSAIQKNEITSMGGAGTISAGPGGGKQVFKEGLPKGAYYNQVSLGALISDGTNEQELDFAPNVGQVVPKGEIYGIQGSDEPVFIGTNVPKYIGSLTTNLSAYGFNLYVLTEWKTGFFIYNEQVIDQVFTGGDYGFFGGVGTNSLVYDQLATKLGFGNYTGDAALTPGTPEYIDVANQYASMSVNADANAIQPGDFLKIREVSLTYDFKNLVRNSNTLKGLRLGVAATNVLNVYKRKFSLQSVRTDAGEEIKRWMSGYSGLDSENTALGFNNSPASGIQSGTLPQGRTFTATITLTF